jgi:hypothetical protein
MTLNLIFINMKLKNLILCLCFLISTVSLQSSFFYSETFTGTSADGWVFDGKNDSITPFLTSNTIDDIDDGWLRLTESKKNQSAFAYYDTAFVSTGLDLNVSFDFSIYDGTGADGFTFFLMDGSIDPSPGAFGGSLGYANRFGNNGTPIDGLAGAYIGIGFDEYGNFSNNNEGRNGGIGFVPNSITLRGSGNGTSGYEYITHANLDEYGQLDFPDISSRPDQSGVGYRHAIISLTADDKLTVQVKLGNNSVLETIIDSFDVSSFLMNRPETLMFGFSASTGSSKEIHEIRNLIVNGNVPVIPEPSSRVIVCLACLSLISIYYITLKFRNTTVSSE